MATAAVIREQLTKAKRYLEDMTEYKRLRGTEDEVSQPDEIRVLADLHRTYPVRRADYLGCVYGYSPQSRLLVQTCGELPRHPASFF